MKIYGFAFCLTVLLFCQGTYAENLNCAAVLCAQCPEGKVLSPKPNDCCRCVNDRCPIINCFANECDANRKCPRNKICCGGCCAEPVVGNRPKKCAGIFCIALACAEDEVQKYVNGQCCPICVAKPK